MASVSKGCTAALGNLLGGRVIRGLYRQCRAGNEGARAWFNKELAALVSANKGAAGDAASPNRVVVEWIVMQIKKNKRAIEGDGSAASATVKANDVVSTVASGTIRIPVRRSDLLLLLPGMWLNSDVIDAFATVVKQKCDDPTVDWRQCYIDSHDMPRGEKNFLRFLGLAGKASEKARDAANTNSRPRLPTRLVTTVNYGNTHWAVVCVDRRTPCAHTGSAAYNITLYNSLESVDEQVLGTLRRWIQKAHVTLKQNQTPAIQVRQGRCTKQANNSDCGVFACRFAMHLLCREPVPVPPPNLATLGDKGDEGCSDKQFRSLIASMLFASRTAAGADGQ